MARPPLSVCVGLALIIVGATSYASFYRWNATRIFVAFDRPVSLKPGHIRTGPFPTNVPGDYQVYVAVDSGRPRVAGCEFDVYSHASWIVYRGGQEVSSSRTGFSWTFYGEGGNYDVDFEVLKDASCLDAAHPRLQVSTTWKGFDDLARDLDWLFAMCVGIGATMLVLAAKRRREDLRPPVPQLDPSTTAPAHIAWKRKPDRKGPLQVLPSWSLFTANILTLLTFIMMVWTILDHYPIYGLRVRILRPGIVSQRSLGIQPLLVELRGNSRDPRPKLYMDFQPVPWDDFDTAIEKEIRLRPLDWPVYFQADPDLDYRWAAEAMDRLKGWQVEVILLTHSPARTN